ncbi:MAG: hypothetical protein OEU32_04870 [Acidimicrobiia bacterium]|nr:hypothetical protein [Acidimicrobiia bacterium]
MGRTQTRATVDRRVVAALLVLALAIILLLSLSDAVPVIVKRTATFLGVQEAVKTLSPRHDPWLPAHALTWAVLTTALCVTIRDKWSRAVAATALFLFSFALEIGQDRWTATRHFQTEDIIANLTGVSLGLVIAVLLYTRLQPHRTL